jgi:hypothetical protein
MKRFTDCTELMCVGGDTFMINVCRSIWFTTQMLQDNEKEQSTQYRVIDEPRPTATYSNQYRFSACKLYILK